MHFRETIGSSSPLPGLYHSPSFASFRPLTSAFGLNPGRTPAIPTDAASGRCSGQPAHSDTAPEHPGARTRSTVADLISRPPHADMFPAPRPSGRPSSLPSVGDERPGGRVGRSPCRPAPPSRLSGPIRRNAGQSSASKSENGPSRPGTVRDSPPCTSASGERYLLGEYLLAAPPYAGGITPAQRTFPPEFGR